MDGAHEVERGRFAVTSWLYEAPLFPVNQESPFFLMLPIVLQPGGPALAGLTVIFPFSG